MRYTSVNEQGDIVYHYSVSKEVEQFHYLTALMEAKDVKAFSKSKSTLDFKTLQFNNEASWELDENQEEELFSRRYTLPRGFKYNARSRTTKSRSSTKKEVKEEEDETLKGLNISKSISSFYLHSMFLEQSFETNDTNCTSFQNLGLKQLFYEPKLQPSVSYFNLANLFKEEVPLSRSLENLNIRSLFKEDESEPEPFEEDFNLDILFQEENGAQSRIKRKSKAMKNLKKAFTRPFIAVRRAVLRLC